MRITNFLRSFFAEVSPRSVVADGGSTFVTNVPEGWGGNIEEINDNVVEIKNTVDGRVALYDGGTLVYTYSSRAAARRGAQRRGLAA